MLLLMYITDENGENIQVAYAGIYSQPVVRRTKALRALNRASETNETGYPNLAREVNLYEHWGLDKRLEPIAQHFWADQDGAHVTEIGQDEFVLNPANGGGNLLAKSQGLYLRNGLTDLASFTTEGVNFYEEGSVVASFSSDAVTLGAGSMQALLNNSGLTINKDGLTRVELGESIVYYKPNGEDLAVLINEEQMHYEGAKDFSVEMEDGAYFYLIGAYTTEFGYYAPNYAEFSAMFNIGTDTDHSVSLGIGDDGNNHGVYSMSNGQWIICANGYGGATSEVLLNRTSSSAGNVVIANNGNLSKGTNSSRRYKKDIKDIGGELDPAKLYDARVVQFKYRDDYLMSDDQRFNKDMGGFIVEELEKVYPIAIDYSEGQPEDWNYRYLVPPMLKLIQDQKTEIDNLKERLGKIEGRTK